MHKFKIAQYLSYTPIKRTCTYSYSLQLFLFYSFYYSIMYSNVIVHTFRVFIMLLCIFLLLLLLFTIVTERVSD